MSFNVQPASDSLDGMLLPAQLCHGVLNRLAGSRVDMAKDVDEFFTHSGRKRRTGERFEVGVEVVAVTGSAEGEVDSWLVAAETVGGIGQ